MALNRSSITIGLLVLLTGFCGIAASITGLYLYVSPNLPSVESLREIKFQTPLRIYSADNQLIGEFGEIRRIPVSYENTPDLLIKAFLAAEDDRFYSHNGVDIKGLLRAVSRLVQTGERQGGGSTITMQVAKNSFPINDGSFLYKAKQIFLALKIEDELEKNEILELYINQNTYGNRAVGAGAAAQVYYGRGVSELDLAQLAMISGIPQAPSVQNPLVNPPRAKRRRDWILGRMLNLGYINNEDYQAAIGQPVTASYHGQRIDVHAPYIAEMVRRHMLDQYGDATYSEGFKVYTTVDSRLQAVAQQAVVDGLLEYTNRHGYLGPEQNFPPTALPLETVATDASEELPENENSDESIEEDLEEIVVYNVREKLPPDSNREKFFGSSEEDTRPIIAKLNLAPWQNELRSIASYGELEPAIVVEAYDQFIRLLLKNGELKQLPWENGPSEARPHISEDNRGPKPEKAEDIFKPGDVIRIIVNNENNLQLSQIPKAQAALVALNPDDGAVRSLVGGFNFSYSNYNRAVQAKRQPGSNFKPFVYTAALESGYTAATIINDAPIIKYDSTLEKAWRPENSGGKFNGPMRLREGLYRSINNVAIKVLDSVGFTQTIRGMDRFGFDKSELPRDLTLALGSHVLTPMQVARGYTVFANGGYKIEPYFITRIEDSDSNVLFEAMPITVCRECEKDDRNGLTLDDAALAESDDQVSADELTEVIESDQLNSDNDTIADTATNEENQATASDSEIAEESVNDLIADGIAIADDKSLRLNYLPHAERVLDERVAFIMDSILKDVIRRGTGVKARSLGRGDIAGKTGTVGSDVNNFDAWFSGYTPNLVASAWIGFDQNLPLGRGEFGASAALPIWMSFMKVALDGMPETYREQPPGIVSVRINSKTGLRAQPGDPNYIFEYFREENVPELDTTSDILIPDGDNGEFHPDEVF